MFAVSHQHQHGTDKRSHTATPSTPPHPLIMSAEKTSPVGASQSSWSAGGSAPAEPTVTTITSRTISPAESAAPAPAAAVAPLREIVPGVVLLDTVETCRAAVTDLLIAGEDVAMDIEGVNLCRAGQVCVVQLARRDPALPVLLIDVSTLGQTAFDEGRLRDLLESKAVVKLVFDPRNDADALWHIHKIRLRNVVDVQVLYCRANDARNDCFLKGLAKAFERYRGLTRAERHAAEVTKQAGLALFEPRHGGDFEVWQRRPLRPELAVYAAQDVRHLHGMAEQWSSTGPGARFGAIEAAEKRIAKTIAGPNPRTLGKRAAYKDF